MELANGAATDAAAEAQVEAELTVLVSGGDIGSLIRWCEEWELDLKHSLASTALSLGVYKVHLLAYLLAAQLDLARFLWRRTPPSLRDDAELQAIWEVGRRMWVEDRAGVQAALAAAQWSSPLVATLARALQRRTLEDAFQVMGKAYSSIQPASLVEKLGVPLSTVQELASSHGWTIDIETGAYKPVPAESPAVDSIEMGTLQQLTNFVAHLEREIR